MTGAQGKNGDENGDEQGRWGLRLPISFAQQREIFLYLVLLEDDALAHRPASLTCAGAVRAARERTAMDWEIPDKWVLIIVEKGVLYNWPPFEEE